MAYAILRTAKLKTLRHISNTAELHNQRLNNVQNANPDLAHLNIHMGAKNVADRVNQIIRDNDINVRKNAVIAVEYLLTASPEFFANKSKAQVSEWIKSNISYLKNNHPNLVSVDVHFDETTPHIHAIVVPVVSKAKTLKDGTVKQYNTLDATQWLGGAKKLKNMQTDYAKAMKPFGLERGIEGSKAHHKDIKKFYGELNKAISETNNELKNKIAGAKEILSEKPSIWNAKTYIQKVKQFAVNVLKVARTSAVQNQVLKQKLEQAEQQHEQQIVQLLQENTHIKQALADFGLEPTMEGIKKLEELAKKGHNLEVKELEEMKKDMENIDLRSPLEQNPDLDKSVNHAPTGHKKAVKQGINHTKNKNDSELSI